MTTSVASFNLCTQGTQMTWPRRWGLVLFIYLLPCLEHEDHSYPPGVVIQTPTLYTHTCTHTHGCHKHLHTLNHLQCQQEARARRKWKTSRHFPFHLPPTDPNRFHQIIQFPQPNSDTESSLFFLGEDCQGRWTYGTHLLWNDFSGTSRNSSR